MIFAVDDLVDYFIKGDKDPELFLRLQNVVADIQKKAEAEKEAEKDSYDMACEEWDKGHKAFCEGMRNMSKDEIEAYEVTLSETAPIPSDYKVFVICELFLKHHTTDREIYEKEWKRHL